jgi:cysteine desulfurase / selenocysteine lyase
MLAKKILFESGTRDKTPSQELFDPDQIRRDFPLFVARPGLAYLDSAASSQKPQCVIDRLTHFLSFEHANIHRGAYALSADATERYEEAREAVARFLGAANKDSIIFTRGTTESINLVAHSLERWFQPGDSILLTLLEHHSNIVPWQLLAERRGLHIEFADITADAALDREDFLRKLSTLRPKLVAFTAHSNAFGTILPVDELIAEARAVGAKVLIDAAQAAVHGAIRVEALGADFLAFSGHKVYGPTGIGALYVEPGMYDLMNPFLGGGDMIETVTTEGSTWAQPPQRFEAGTPAIAEAIALGTAVQYVGGIGIERVATHERELFSRAYERLRSEPGVTVYGPVTSGGAQASILAFTVDSVHPHDFASIADAEGVQVRAGNHCAMPALRRLGLSSTVRASLGMYSRDQDIDLLIDAIRRSRSLFK